MVADVEPDSRAAEDDRLEGPPGEGAAPRRLPRFSVAGRAAAATGVVAGLAAAAAATAVAFGAGAIGTALTVLAVSVPAALGLAVGLTRRPLRLLRALQDGVRGFRSGDFSLRLVVGRQDELGELVELYNLAGDAMRRERSRLRQRELIFEAMVESSQAAVVLVNAMGRVIFASRGARHVLGGGERLEGRHLDEVRAALPDRLAAAVAEGSSTLVSLPEGDDEEVYHVLRRVFELNAARHVLVTVRRVTPELRRREVQVWKRLIRVISHELNNGLAPISSLLHSARQVRARPEQAHRLDDVLATLDESVSRLHRFIEGYARFARLPAPRLEAVALEPFLTRLAELEPFTLAGPFPQRAVRLDPSQVQTVLLNLVGNAREAGSHAQAIVVSAVAPNDGGCVIEVADRGPGMDEETLARALLPFYSSKKGGTGLGLALCREIVEAHGGRVELANRPGGGLAVRLHLPG